MISVMIFREPRQQLAPNLLQLSLQEQQNHRHLIHLILLLTRLVLLRYCIVYEGQGRKPTPKIDNYLKTMWMKIALGKEYAY